MLRWLILGAALAAPPAALVLVACTSSDSQSGGSHVHIGCEAGAGCVEDTNITGICAQDRPHMCFCGANGSTAVPSPDCLGTVVKPPAPYSKAYCCP
jgi:hypothetical protein